MEENNTESSSTTERLVYETSQEWRTINFTDEQLGVIYNEPYQMREAIYNQPYQMREERTQFNFYSVVDHYSQRRSEFVRAISSVENPYEVFTEGPYAFYMRMFRSARRESNSVAYIPSYNKEENYQEEGECSICLESYKNCTVVKCSRCKPLHHLSCVEKGKLLHCPTCRTKY